MTKASGYDLHEALGYRVSQTARVLEQGFEIALRDLGLTRSSWCILLAVDQENISRPSAISDFVGIDKTATSRALRQMQADGLIDRASGDADRRTTTVNLTDKGRTALHQSLAHARDNARRFEARLSAEERADLLKILEKLRGENRPDLSRI